MSKKFFITGGGTGGHIYPAVAIYEELLNFVDAKNIFYIGNPKNLENDIAQKNNMNFLGIEIFGMPRKFSFGFGIWCFNVLKAILLAVSYIKTYKPDFIIGTGGYVSFPVIVAGILCGVPFCIHDSDACPGIVSRVSAPFAKYVFLAFEDAKKYLISQNIIINGNPLRSFDKNLSKLDAIKKLGLDTDKKTIFVMGGSQGAKSINKIILELAEILTINHSLQIIHQTGAKNFEEAKNHLPGGLFGYILEPYFDNMELPYCACDFVIARAGSISISEINNYGLGAVLIPYPYAASNHQLYNAKSVEKQNAAIVLEEKNLNSHTLLEVILSIVNNEDKLSQMNKNSLSLAKPDATRLLVQKVLTYFEIASQHCRQ